MNLDNEKKIKKQLKRALPALAFIDAMIHNLPVDKKFSKTYRKLWEVQDSFHEIECILKLPLDKLLSAKTKEFLFIGANYTKAVDKHLRTGQKAQ